MGHSYFIELLQLIIDKSSAKYGAADLTVINIANTTHGRSLILLERGAVDVFWAGTNTQREARFIPVRIPLFFGLLGYRVSIIHQENLQKFDTLKQHPEQLKQLVACQGEHWPDSDILTANDYKVMRVSRFELMFTMLANQRCDYFPRAIFEGYGELEIAKKTYPNLIMYDQVILHYQFPIYYFVNQKRPDLAARLEYGLQQAIKEGALLSLMQHHEMTKSLFPLSQWNNKSYIELKNKDLPKETPVNDVSLWINLHDIGSEKN
ncbi:hypothetical protein [Thalassotalea marina]|uniref:hypothetical protein n=1 Tax=Thalassotalea marina TaxID=1673741 RepID=UPI001674C9E2|nr:hypothetical protein [Thalassotalea marina]